jgi:hypothetical protein
MTAPSDDVPVYLETFIEVIFAVLLQRRLPVRASCIVAYSGGMCFSKNAWR